MAVLAVAVPAMILVFLTTQRAGRLEVVDEDVKAAFFNAGYHMTAKAEYIRRDKWRSWKPPEVTRGLFLCTPHGGCTSLHSLKQLQGAVKIDTPDEALLFVRLLTSPSTAARWHQMADYEVISQSAAGELPRFGLPPGDRWIPDLPGFKGVLPEKEFKGLGFAEPATFTLANGKGFKVRRWLFGSANYLPGGPTIWYVEEHIGSDGAYTRKVLKEMEPPDYPRINWSLDNIRG